MIYLFQFLLSFDLSPSDSEFTIYNLQPDTPYEISLIPIYGDFEGHAVNLPITTSKYHFED